MTRRFAPRVCFLSKSYSRRYQLYKLELASSLYSWHELKVESWNRHLFVNFDIKWLNEVMLTLVSWATVLWTVPFWSYKPYKHNLKFKVNIGLFIITSTFNKPSKLCSALRASRLFSKGLFFIAFFKDLSVKNGTEDWELTLLQKLRLYINHRCRARRFAPRVWRNKA